MLSVPLDSFCLTQPHGRAKHLLRARALSSGEYQWMVNETAVDGKAFP